MTTKIFSVDYKFTEVYDGKQTDSFKESKTVTAKNAQDAISKVWTILQKPYSFTTDDKKKVKVVRKDFDPINVNLLAEAE